MQRKMRDLIPSHARFGGVRAEIRPSIFHPRYLYAGPGDEKSKNTGRDEKHRGAEWKDFYFTPGLK